MHHRGMQEIHLWHGDASTDSLKPCCRICNPRWEDLDPIALNPDYDIDPPIDRPTAINYELAGRSDASHSFRDFRSPAKARKRHRERNEKYYSWRGVKPGQLGKPHNMPKDERGTWYATTVDEAPIACMTKRQLYVEAQMWPRPPKLHYSKPWETRQEWGPARWHYRRKRFGRDLGEDVYDALGRWPRCLVTGGHAELVWPESVVHVTACAYDHCCGYGCAVCHGQECCPRDQLDAEDAVGEDQEEATPHEETVEEWEILSPTATGSEYGRSDGWDLVDVSDTSASDQGWVLASSYGIRALLDDGTSNTGDDDGYSSQDMESDLENDRCSACLADDRAQTRIREYTNSRLCDVAFLRGTRRRDRSSTRAFQRFFPSGPLRARDEWGDDNSEALAGD